MAKKAGFSRKDLLQRWSVIEQEDDDDDNAAFSSVQPVKRRRLRQLKEQWFSDAFNFLIHLPKDDHVWCGYWDLMGPLLETFYNFPKDESLDSPLKLLWKRISREMRGCTLCIHQHHQAQEMYQNEYEQSCIGPLLDVLRTLDEDRITLHLKNLNDRILKGEYDTSRDYGEVVSVMFEVLMFPILLDDQNLATEFQNFVEAIDNSHDLALDGHQQYPGVYALLFFKSRRVRSIGLRLAGHMGKLRRSTDLDPLQHLLKKCIYVLETEGVQAALETSRPRVQLDRLTVWLGMKALVGFLEPPAFEEGILDRYPIFLSIVLNHISDDSIEFSYAVNCLRLLFEKLGCKLWLRATLSPSVMRNTLLGQCFHTRNEKSHKEIFDLFQPFLQSLEALQDGEHEKQRRHFLYFLLHQVPVSSNFSILMRKKACQIAFLIVLRGYRMDPPCPPSECAHMWGPFLVSFLKDTLLHSSLRQPAIDLIQTIIVSDASALISIILNGQLHPSDKPIRPTNSGDADDEEEILSTLHAKENDTSCWKEFALQHKVVSQVDGSWMCVPMLWFDVLVEIDPLALPLSFSKAVIWALSRFSLIETENSTEMSLSVRNWLTTCASEISYLLGWKVPSGSDDGGDGTESRNSIRTSTMCRPLVRTFKRLTTHYTIKMEQGELRKQWTWEPVMSNSLLLLLVDPNDNTRQVGRLILEQVSNVRGLTCGLQFLCSTPSSLLASLLGLRHALKLVQLDSVLSNFSTLHHLFFILCKLLKEGNPSTQTKSQNLSDVTGISQFSLQGGFLKQPVFESSPTDGDGHLSIISSPWWKRFSCLLSQAAWPSILKCLDGGKAFTDYTVSQMTCIRILEVIPVVFERHPSNSAIMLETFYNIKWLHDLADWGKSSLAVVVRYWKQTLSYLLGQIKEFCSDKSTSAISDIEKIISHEKVPIDEVSKQVARLSISLKEECFALNKTATRLKFPPLEEPSLVDEAKVTVLHSEPLVDLERGEVIILSDDEKELDVSAHVGISNTKTTYYDDHTGTSTAGGLVVSSEAGSQLGSYSTDLVQKRNSDNTRGMQASQSPVPAEPSQNMGEKVETRDGVTNCFLTRNNSSLMKVSDRAVNSKEGDSSAPRLSSSNKTNNDLSMISASKIQQNVNKVPKASDEVTKEIVCDADDDAWNFSFFKPPRRQQPLTTKPSTSAPKRQVIQLSLPPQSRPGSMRLDGGMKRFQPPRLDDWYRPILELDFFVAVGLASGTEKDSQSVGKLKEIPVCFQSPDGYFEIFRPLVVEEFKAQLQSSYQEMTSSEELCCGSLSVLSVERIDDFHVVRFVQDEVESPGSRSLMENDLILLTRQPLQNSISDIHTVGKVERREKDNKRRSNILAIRLYLQGCSRLNRARKLLTERSKWYVSRIMSITPQLREFHALSSIREIPLLPIILNPINYHSGQYKSETQNLSKLPQHLQQIFKSSYNESQLQAISLATGPFDLKKDFELTLIQGPPGTGKTRTVLAIVSGLLALSQMKDSKRLRNCGSECSNIPSTNQRISQSAAIARAWQDAALARQLNEDVVKNNKSTGSYSRGRILICAQSNAAVDELVARISNEGLYGCDGQRYTPYLVRVGNARTVHPNSLPFFIDTLVENRLGEEKRNAHDEKSGTSADSLSILRTNLEKLVEQIRYYEAKRASLQEENSESKNFVEGDLEDGKAFSDAELKGKLRQLYEKKKNVYTELASAQVREKKANEEIRALRHKFRNAILKEAEIVVTTLSGCGGDLYGVCSESTSGHKFINASETTLFDAVVIDEAAQALEPATLIPLQLLKSRGTKCIMVGDPKQLPATVLSNVASKYMFQCSMFERLQRAGHPVIMLTQQYRMHPEICRFPSLHFYEGKLLNGDKMSVRAASFHETRCLGPYAFFDIIDGLELRGKNSASLSLYNESEADAAVEVLRFFKKSYPSEFWGGRIGVITPYKRQLSLLRSRFTSAFGSSITSDMEFNTVDGFQGREVDILLLSTVRASGSCDETPRGSSSNIGFVADVRRMNVALTRAKLSLWVFGNARTLQTNRTWAALLEDAKQRNLIVSARKPYSSIYKFSSENISSAGNSCTQLKEDEQLKGARKYVNTQKTVKHASERKRKCISSAPESVCNGEEVPHLLKDAAIDDKRRTRDGSGTKFSVAKELASVKIPNNDNKLLKGSMLKLQENPEKTDISPVFRDNDEQIKVVKTDVGKGSDNDNVRKHLTNTGKVKSRSQKHMRPVADDVRSKTIKLDKQPEVKIGTSSSERRFKEKGEPEASNQAEMLNDTIKKRKQQREAVDALLSSALISSKKSESVMKSSKKRTLSTSTNRPHRRRND
ncbi:P-loop containing nucleoside triphosphate hydrolases superfamily protein [Perilla frutescens var. hirtella]|nr:P-loop containing nucleoside triphosphate hydrolases superfamily protein [Perilla frutescens var. frutescens]KAH6793378.1 P-loop containing nucleoside triphosphate hydrolases superfamily protein [Perilla frutescens var. hirtella]